MSIVTVRSNTLPAELRGPITISRTHKIRFWPTAYFTIHRRNLKSTTYASEVAAINLFYDFCDQLSPAVDLDRMISDADVAGLTFALSAYLPNRISHASHAPVGANQTWQYAYEFVSATLHLVGAANGKLQGMGRSLRELEALYSQMDVSPPRPKGGPRALPALVIEDCFQILHPHSERNPFRSEALKWRNLLIFHMMFTLGICLGEILALPEWCVQEDFDYAHGRNSYWIDINTFDDAFDTRSKRPSHKTAFRRRKIPLSEELLTLIRTYRQSYRGVVSHQCLLSSQKGGRLAAQTVGDLFRRISGALSPDSRQALRQNGYDNVTPHALRHTATAARLQSYVNAGANQDEATQKARLFFGWSPTSAMPFYYGEVFWQTRHDEVWMETFESHAAALRQIHGAQQ